MDKIAPLSEPYNYDDPDNTSDKDSDQIQSPCIVAAAAGDAAASDRLISTLQAYATIEEYEAGLGSDVTYIHAGTGQQQQSLSKPGLTVQAMANLARYHIMKALRSRQPYKVCLLIAGMMTTTSATTTTARKQMFLSETVQHQVQTAWKTDSTTTTTTSPSTGTTDDVNDTDEAPTSTTTTQEDAIGLEPRLYWLDEYGSSQSLQYGAHGYGSNFCLSILDQGYSEDMDIEEALKLMKNCFQQLRTRYVINSPQPPCIKCVDQKGIRLIR
eukprot:scaffold1580_cov116-Cylindrotheca_fusiformis.AAC.1